MTIAENAELGNVRIVCEQPELLVGRLSISDIITRAELQTVMPEICEGYETDAVVPDPRTFRPCTDAEITHYGAGPNDVADIRDPSVVVYFPASDTRLDTYRQSPNASFGLTLHVALTR